MVAVIGKTEFKGPQTWLWHVIELTPYLDAFAIADFPTQIVWGPSNNFSCRKTIFKQLGGFDENCPQPIGGEDAELGYRLYHEGYMMHTCPEAVVYHSTETWNTLPQVLQRLTRWSRGDIYLKRRNWISLYYSCPSRFGTVLILIPLAILISLTTKNYVWLSWSLLFIIFNFILRALQKLAAYPPRFLHPFRIFAAESLILFYDFQNAWQCLRWNCWKLLFTYLLLRPEDAQLLWNENMKQLSIRGFEIGISFIFYLKL